VSQLSLEVIYKKKILWKLEFDISTMKNKYFFKTSGGKNIQNEILATKHIIDLYHRGNLKINSEN
jgi:hypothetical protein